VGARINAQIESSIPQDPISVGGVRGGGAGAVGPQDEGCLLHRRRGGVARQLPRHTRWLRTPPPLPPQKAGWAQAYGGVLFLRTPTRIREDLKINLQTFSAAFFPPFDPSAKQSGIRQDPAAPLPSRGRSGQRPKSGRQAASDQAHKPGISPPPILGGWGQNMDPK